MGKKVRIDFHTHTVFSNDAFTSMHHLNVFLKKNPDFIIAVTDHDEIKGALEAKNLFGERIIVGEEVKSKQGEIIGLFIESYIQSGLDAQETIDMIHKQNGLVMIPHPFKKHGKSDSPLSRNLLFSLCEHFDIIEIFNARNRTPGANECASVFAESLGKSQAVGSDSHAIHELGRTCVCLPEYRGAEGLVENLKYGKHICRDILFSHRLLTRILREVRKRGVLWARY